ncbi:MAG: protein kinase [Planctomycetes bacterium]|nr:protein kinase [Planctomycetota bacterium]
MSEVGIIHVVDGEQAGQDVKLPADDKKFTIGRRSNCDLMLRVDSISREHCYIQRQGDDYWLYDNGSANATLLNGMAIEKAKLVHGDVLTLDRVTLEYLSPSQTPGTREMIREFVVSKGAGSQQTYTAENSLLGKTVDSYKLLSVLGEGGMAMVYKARNEKDQSLVAVKFLKGGPQADRENTARFLKEFKTGAKLHHPNIMQILALGENDGSPYIAMEYIDGSSLQEILDEKGRLSQKAALKVGVQVAKALEYAFSNNVIHRDIKPENVMISRQGEVKVADLGLAKEIKQFVSINITKTGEGIGTLHYMSPEQVENTKGVDQRADIYSLGATIYECLCGQPPFDEVGVWKFVEAINNKEPPPLPQLVDNLHPKMWPMIEKSLRKKPKERQQTPTEFRQEMEAILAELD